MKKAQFEQNSCESQHTELATFLVSETRPQQHTHTHTRFLQSIFLFKSTLLSEK